MKVLAASLYGKLFSQALMQETADGALLIQSAPGRYLTWSLAFVVLVMVTGWCWRRRLGGAYAPGFLFASFLIPILILPALATESVRVTGDVLNIRTGIWFDPTVMEIPLANVKDIVERKAASKSRRLRGIRETYWHFQQQSGKVQVLDLPDLLDANRAAVADFLRRRGIEVRVVP